MSLALVYENFIWRLETLTPTESACNERFRYVDPEALDLENARHRSFSVFWESSDADIAPTDLYDREAAHVFTVEVFYRVGEAALTSRKAHQLIASDRADISKELRNPSSWNGYDQSNTGDDIGLCDRLRLGDELERVEHLYIYRAQWQCHVRESE